MSLSQLVAVLESVPQQFSTLALSEQAAEQALATARLVHAATQAASRSDFSEAGGRLLDRPLAAVAHSLSQLAAAAAPVLAQPGGGPACLERQVDAGCAILESLVMIICGAAGLSPQLAAQTARQMEAACSLIFGPGRASLQTLLAATQAGEKGVASVLRYVCRAQLHCVMRMASGLPHRDRRPQAAFATTIAQPSALLPWLAALSRTMPQAISSGAEADSNVAAVYMELIHILLSSEAWSQHSAAIAADPALRQAIVGTLLAYCLPALAVAVRTELPAGLDANGLGSTLLHTLPSLLQHPSLAPAGQERAAVAAAAVEQAAALVRSIAAAYDQRSGMAGRVYMVALINATAVLSMCCTMLTGSQPVEAVGNHDSSEAAPAPRQAEQQTAGWHVAALLPQLQAAVAALAGSLQGQPLSAETEGSMQGVCDIFRNMCSPLSMMSGLQLSDSSPQQVCAWLAAATAGLQLLPCAAWLAESQWQRRDLTDKHVTRFTGRVQGVFLDRLPPQIHQLLKVQRQRQQQQRQRRSISQQDMPLGEAAAWDGLPTQLWALHTSVCRLIAALSAPVAPLCLPGLQLNPGDWRFLLGSINTLYAAIVESTFHARGLLPSWQLCSLNDLPRDVRGQLQSVSAGHVAAAQLAAAAASESFAQPNRADVFDAGMLAAGLHLAASVMPSAVEPALLAPMVTLIQRDRQGLKTQLKHAANMCCLLGCPSASLAAALAGTSIPRAALELAAHLERAHAGHPKAAEQVAELRECVTSYESALVHAVSGAASSAAVSDAPNKLAEQLRAAAQQLQGRLQEGLSSTQETAQLLQNAAALMQQYQALPAVEADRQLVLAQAASGRSCAYLRCANLGGEGGPAAGQGVGSMRCSACRAVWYCGTACSHADWREGGHRRVCKALGAARRAAKEAAAAAADTAAAQE